MKIKIKISIQLILLTIASMSLSSCTEVIELDLNDASPQIVVEATLTNSSFNNQVILSKSSSFDQTGQYERLSEATVTITDDAGNTFPLTESDQGVYTHPSLVGTAETSYQLSIVHEGQTYEASSYLPEPIIIDSVTFEYGARTPMRDEGYLMKAHFHQESASATYVRFWVEVNGEPQDGYFLYNATLPVDDEGTFSFIQASFQQGDEITLVAGAIDEAVYAYYYQLAEVTGNGIGPTAAAPANPTSNVSNGALGYFGAIGLQAITSVVE